jgi:DNA repair protein RadB
MIKVQKDLDTLLGGGLQPRTITHIYGAPGAGKTNIALMAAVSAAKAGGKVVYIDAEGGFSVERLKQIAGPREAEDALRNIILIEPTEFAEQKVAINRLNEIVPSSSAKLVIVDSIAVLYRLEEDKDIKELGRQMAKLLRIALKYDIPVLITNQIYTDIDTGRTVPIGGDVIRYWAKISLELDKRDSMRTAILKKHKFLPENLRMEYRIIERGMETLRVDIPAETVIEPV